MSDDRRKISRRTILGYGAGAVAVGVGVRAQAQTKIPREQVMYVEKTQTTGRFCANCMHWQGTPVADYSQLDEANPVKAECAIVAGEVVGTGWCGVWAPRG